MHILYKNNNTSLNYNLVVNNFNNTLDILFMKKNSDSPKNLKESDQNYEILLKTICIDKKLKKKLKNVNL